MRVIAGRARGFRLETAPGHAVRPTADRVREALFSILGNRVAGGAFVDLYAGSGAVGLEALSRGARHATFVERDRAALKALSSNLRRCGFEGQARVIGAPVIATLRGGALAGGDYDIAFLDPPYRSEETATALGLVAAGKGILSGGGVVVLEHGRSWGPPGSAGSLSLSRTALYGDTALSFYAFAPPV